MKMSMMVSMALVGGMGIMGYMYLKKHPEIMNMMMDMKKDAAKNINDMMN